MPTYFHRDSFQRYFEFPLPLDVNGKQVLFVDIKEGDPNDDDIILVKLDMSKKGDYYLLSKVTGEVALVQNNYKDRAIILVQTQPSGKDRPIWLEKIPFFKVVFPEKKELDLDDPQILTLKYYTLAEWSKKKRKFEYKNYSVDLSSE